MTHKRIAEPQQNGSSHTDTLNHNNVHNSSKNDNELFRRRMFITMGGLYGLSVSVMGIVVPFTYFVSLWAQQKIVYFYLFYGYVFLLSLGFMVYASVKAHHLRLQREVNDLPSVLTTHDGINVYLIFALVVFGSLSILFHILILVSYKQDPLQYVCYGTGQIATSVLVIVFVLCQMIFLLMHSKTIFNFQPIVMKLGLMHLIAANMCNWGLAVLFEAAEVYLHTSNISRHDAAADSTTPAGHKPGTEEFVARCLQLNTTAIKGSPYLMPFFVEFSLTSVGVVYRILQNVGTTPTKPQLVLIDRKNEHLLTAQSCSPLDPFTYGGWLLKILTIVVTVVFILIQEGIITPQDAKISGSIYTGTQYVLLAIALVVTSGAAYHTSKCHYVRHNKDSFFDEMLLLLSLGGFYFLLAFVIIASCYMSIEPGMSPISELYILWAVISYIQATVQVIYIRDGLRRRALTRYCLTNRVAKTFIILTAVVNECLWVVMSFMLKEITSSKLMIKFYSSLTWVIISSTFMPLAIFFRFHSAACISDVIEVLYHGTCYVGGHRISTKHWIVKQS